MTFLVLLDQKAPVKANVQDWLNKNGWITWLASDLSHAIEELSDFTVRDRPDVVLLEVAFLNDSFDSLRSTLTRSSSSEKITVLGLTGNAVAEKSVFAKDVDQLDKFMHREDN